LNPVNFETLAFANRLKEAGADYRQAEAIASGLAEEETGDKIATKADVAEVRAEIADLRTQVADVKS